VGFSLVRKFSPVCFSNRFIVKDREIDFVKKDKEID